MKVAIAGYGAEGEVNYEYWKSLGHEVTIFDGSETPTRPLPKGAQAHVGGDSLQNIFGYDLVVRTAGLNPKKIKTDGKIWSATNEFFEKCQAPIIGVTGTKGKGTTTSLIAAILSEAGKTVHVVGNIGVPALDVLPSIAADDIVVFELSSFQLWDIERSPETAVVLMIEPDHQDIHGSMEDYVLAKGGIARNQKADDLLICHPTNVYSAQIAALSPANKLHYATNEAAHVDSGFVVIHGQKICSIDEVGLIGPHNLDNICAAVTASWRYINDVEACKRALIAFKGLEHRLEFVRELNGVKFYNDSFSSAPGATIAAIKSFDQPEVLICGGFDKHVDLTNMAQEITARKNVKSVLLIGQTGPAIGQVMDELGYTKHAVCETTDFTDIVTRAYKQATSGDVVLLSPGCASFDMFKNFYDRGEQFKEIVRGL